MLELSCENATVGINGLSSRSELRGLCPVRLGEMNLCSLVKAQAIPYFSCRDYLRASLNEPTQLHSAVLFRGFDGGPQFVPHDAERRQSLIAVLPQSVIQRD